MKQYNTLHLIGENIMEFSKKRVWEDRKMVKAWGRLFEVDMQAKYITAEQFSDGLRVCAFITKPVFEQAACDAKGVMYWYPSDYNIDKCLRLAYPYRLYKMNLKPETSIRRILPSGQCVRLTKEELKQTNAS